MKYRPHFNGFRTDHIWARRGERGHYEAGNGKLVECSFVTSCSDNAKRLLTTWLKKTNIIHRLKQNYDRSRVPFITHRQLLKYQGFSGRPKKVL